MEGIYPKALWRPLGNPQEEPAIGIPRLLIWHTMVGYLRSTEQMFRQSGYNGTESTFGVGGVWDGASLDGVIYQWQLCTRQADAQYDGNLYANSIETSDGGNSTRPWTPKQIEAMVDLGVWWCKETGNPPAQAKAWNGVGFGYHRLFSQWNKTAHTCPGVARENQLRTELWPEIVHRLHTSVTPTPVPAQQWPKFPLSTGNFYGAHNNSGIPTPEEGLRVWQRQMAARGWSIKVNGQFDDNCETVTKAFQKEKGLGVDGRVGLQTWNAAWVTPVTS